MKRLFQSILIFLFLPSFAGIIPVSAQEPDIQTRIKSDSLFLEAIVLKENGKYKEAFNAISQAYSADSTSAAILAEISQYYTAFEQDSTAVDALQKAVRYAPEITDYKISLAKLYSDIANYPAAIGLYEELAAANPGKNEFHINLVELYINQGEFEKAIGSLNTLENNIGTNEALSMQKIRLYITTGQKANALDELLKVCEKFPQEADFFIMAGDLYIDMKEYDLALEMLQKGLARVPEGNTTTFSAILGQIGDLYHMQGKKEIAYETYDKALEYNDKNIIVLNNYAYFLSIEKRDLDRAERMIGRCVGAQPTNSTYLDTYAWIFFQRGNYSKAKLYIENAISNIRENNSEIFDHYGDILFKLGKTEQAVMQWEKALEQKLLEGETGIDTLKRKIADKTWYETPVE
jgi:tetratricopeptide (TPR) repeat protein